jgi:hypothetical protein
MNDFIGVCVILVVIALSVVGFTLVSMMIVGDYRLVNDQWSVKQGYAEYIPDTTNGTVRFEWIINKGE